MSPVRNKKTDLGDLGKNEPGFSSGQTWQINHTQKTSSLPHIYPNESEGTQQYQPTKTRRMERKRIAKMSLSRFWRPESREMNGNFPKRGYKIFVPAEQLHGWEAKFFVL